MRQIDLQNIASSGTNEDARQSVERIVTADGYSGPGGERHQDQHQREHLRRQAAAGLRVDKACRRSATVPDAVGWPGSSASGALRLATRNGKQRRRQQQQEACVKEECANPTIQPNFWL